MGIVVEGNFSRQNQRPAGKAWNGWSLLHVPVTLSQSEPVNVEDKPLGPDVLAELTTLPTRPR